MCLLWHPMNSRIRWYLKPFVQGKRIGIWLCWTHLLVSLVFMNIAYIKIKITLSWNVYCITNSGRISVVFFHFLKPGMLLPCLTNLVSLNRRPKVQLWSRLSSIWVILWWSKLWRNPTCLKFWYCWLYYVVIHGFTLFKGFALSTTFWCDFQMLSLFLLFWGEVSIWIMFFILMGSWMAQDLEREGLFLCRSRKNYQRCTTFLPSWRFISHILLRGLLGSILQFFIAWNPKILLGLKVTSSNGFLG